MPSSGHLLCAEENAQRAAETAAKIGTQRASIEKLGRDVHNTEEQLELFRFQLQQEDRAGQKWVCEACLASHTVRV